MKILVIAVGRADRGHLGALFGDYAGRIRKLGVGFEARFVPDLKPGGRFSDAHVKEREARGLRCVLVGGGDERAASEDVSALQR